MGDADRAGQGRAWTHEVNTFRQREISPVLALDPPFDLARGIELVRRPGVPTVSDIPISNLLNRVHMEPVIRVILAVRGRIVIRREARVDRDPGLERTPPEQDVARRDINLIEQIIEDPPVGLAGPLNTAQVGPGDIDRRDDDAPAVRNIALVQIRVARPGDILRRDEPELRTYLRNLRVGVIQHDDAAIAVSDIAPNAVPVGQHVLAVERLHAEVGTQLRVRAHPDELAVVGHDHRRVRMRAFYGHALVFGVEEEEAGGEGGVGFVDG